MIVKQSQQQEVTLNIGQCMAQEREHYHWRLIQQQEMVCALIIPFINTITTPQSVITKGFSDSPPPLTSTTAGWFGSGCTGDPSGSQPGFVPRFLLLQRTCSHGSRVLFDFVCWQGYIVFRFIIEYSSLRDFGPQVIIIIIIIISLFSYKKM